MKRSVVLCLLLAALPGCSRGSGEPGSVASSWTGREMEMIAAELVWGGHLEKARRLVGEGRFSEAEAELWLAELAIFWNAELRRQTRASRLELRSRDSVVHIRCDGEPVSVRRVR